MQVIAANGVMDISASLAFYLFHPNSERALQKTNPSCLTRKTKVYMTLWSTACNYLSLTRCFGIYGCRKCRCDLQYLSICCANARLLKVAFPLPTRKLQYNITLPRELYTILIFELKASGFRPNCREPMHYRHCIILSNCKNTCAMVCLLLNTAIPTSWYGR